MFARRPDASKVAFVTLVRQLQQWGYRLIDCQVHTDHLASLGATNLPRQDFSRILARECSLPGETRPWVLDDDLPLLSSQGRHSPR